MIKKTISRDIINPNLTIIEPNDGNLDKFNFEKLSKNIDYWKYFLVEECGAKKQDKILIGIVESDLKYISLCFAAFELSLKVVIVDYGRHDDFVKNYDDPKTRLLSPIDIFVYDLDNHRFKKSPKHIFFSKHSSRSFNINQYNPKKIDKKKLQDISNIRPSEDDILMVCTSSGTTDTPKIVTHTHEFLYELCKRNSSMFSGSCVHSNNLNHGSSLAVYFLPTLMSKDVKEHFLIGFNIAEPEYFIEMLKDYDICNIIFPYTENINKFLQVSKKKKIKWPHLTVSLLTYIPADWKNIIQEGYVKKFVSIFGSNETSGPVLLSTLSLENVKDFTSNRFFKLDNFYNITFDKDGHIFAELPIYNKTIMTNDIFQKKDNFLFHKGRNDLIRINGVEINLQILSEFEYEFEEKFSIITDKIQNKLYLAIWEEMNKKTALKLTNSLIKRLQKIFKSRNISISKFECLKKDKFKYGIKIDKELIREYFRSNV
jgi:acyl-CoA synthetase (AMP-forming)/AMP-acid ligase II